MSVLGGKLIDLMFISLELILQGCSLISDLIEFEYELCICLDEERALGREICR